MSSKEIAVTWRSGRPTDAEPEVAAAAPQRPRGELRSASGAAKVLRAGTPGHRLGAVAERGPVQHRTPPRSPNHNAVCERFYGTVLRELYRPHFHCGCVAKRIQPA